MKQDPIMAPPCFERRKSIYFNLEVVSFILFFFTKAPLVLGSPYGRAGPDGTHHDNVAFNQDLKSILLERSTFFQNVTNTALYKKLYNFKTQLN